MPPRRAWRRLAPGRTRDPLPLLHSVLVIVSRIKNGHVDFAAACLIMWTCYLRPSEVFEIHAGDVLAPTSSCPHVSLLPHPFERGVGGGSKVGQYDDGMALDMPEMKWFGPGLRKQSSRLPHDQKLLKFTAVSFFCSGLEEPSD